MNLIGLQERKLAVIDDETGFMIPRNLDSKEFVNFIHDRLPTATKYITTSGAHLNPQYDDQLDDPEKEFFSPFVLCLKDNRTWDCYPGKAGNWPTGQLVYDHCVSRGRHTWQENCVILCMSINITYTALVLLKSPK